MATMIPPQKNVEYIFYVSLTSQANNMVMQANPTLAAGDVKVTTDGNALTNLDTTPAVDPAASYFVKVTVSAAEMNGDNIAILFHDAAGDEWNDLMVNIQTARQSLDAMDTLIDAIKAVTDNLPDSGALSDLAAILTDTETTIPGLINALNDPTAAAIADAVWDEVLTGAIHNDATSAGRRLRQAEDVLVIREETCQAGGGNAEIIFDIGASAVNNFYLNDWVLLISGTGTGQMRMITAYIGATKVATVQRDWDVNPDATTTYIIKAVSPVSVYDLMAVALAAINAEVVDTLGVDTLAELAQEAPAATPTIKAALMLLYMIARNKLTTTAIELGVYDDAGTKIAKKTLSDDGTTYTETEMVSGA